MLNSVLCIQNRIDILFIFCHSVWVRDYKLVGDIWFDFNTGEETDIFQIQNISFINLSSSDFDDFLFNTQILSFFFLLWSQISEIMAMSLSTSAPVKPTLTTSIRFIHQHGFSPAGIRLSFTYSEGFVRIRIFWYYASFEGFIRGLEEGEKKVC